MRGIRRDRGTTPALTYVLAIGVVTLLISGLLIATTDFVDGERERVVRDELEIVGERLAADAVAVDRLAGTGAETTQRTTVPETVADVGYYVDVVGCPSGNACLALESADPSFDVNVTVPMDNQSAVTLSRASPRTVRIEVAQRGGLSARADADRGVDSTIGIAGDVSPGLQSSGELFEADTAPVVSGIRYSPTPPTLGNTVTYESDVTTFIEGNYTYRWDLNGDGTIDETGNATQAQTVSYTYGDPGRYNVSLEVVGPNNQSDTVTRLVRVGGVLKDGSATTENVDGDGPTAGFQVALRNNFASESVTITDVEIDPADSSVVRLHNPDVGDPEIAVGVKETYDAGDVVLYEDGRLLELDPDADPIPAGGTTTLTVGEFYDSSFLDDSNQYGTDGQTFEVAVRYETSDKENYVSRFTVTPGSVTGTPTSTPTPGPGPGGDRPRVETVTTQCIEVYGGTYVTVDLTASDPNGESDLYAATVDFYDESGNRERSIVGFGSDDRTFADKYGDDDFASSYGVGDIDRVEVTVYDRDLTPSTTVSREVCS